MLDNEIGVSFIFNLDLLKYRNLLSKHTLIGINNIYEKINQAN